MRGTGIDTPRLQAFYLLPTRAKNVLFARAAGSPLSALGMILRARNFFFLSFFACAARKGESTECARSAHSTRLRAYCSQRASAHFLYFSRAQRVRGSLLSARSARSAQTHTYCTRVRGSLLSARTFCMRSVHMRLLPFPRVTDNAGSC